MAEGKWMNVFMSFRRKDASFLAPIAKCLVANQGLDSVEDLEGVDASQLQALPSGPVAAAQLGYLKSLCNLGVTTQARVDRGVYRQVQ